VHDYKRQSKLHAGNFQNVDFHEAKIKYKHMKKILVSLISLFVLSVSGFSQEDVTVTNDVQVVNENQPTLLNKKGEAILPQSGDIAIGIDLVPFMNYLGNFASSSGTNSFNGNDFLGDSQSLLLKYFLADDAALRVIFRAQNTNTTNTYYVQNDAAIYANPLDINAKTTDQDLYKSSNYALGLGYEKHRVKGRLVGIYGADVAFSIFETTDTYSYGNPFSDINTTPTTYFYGNASRRTISSLGSNGMGFGGDLFLGVEYFFMPNICLGSELSWGASYTKYNQRTHSEEYWNGASVQEQKILDYPSDRSFHLGMNNPSINFYLLFHF
jgi:hypothetical protein